MKDSKNVKNLSSNEKLSEQTPSPAVPNRAHTEMKNASNSKSSKATDSCKKQNTK